MSYLDVRQLLNNEHSMRDFIARLVSGSNPDGTGFTPGGGALMFGQNTAQLTTSLPWRAPGPASFVRGVVTTTAAAESADDVVCVRVNGQAVQALALVIGQTTSVTDVDIDVVAGDLVTIQRLSLEGEGCQVQLDRGA